MPLITWSDALSVGVPELDTQHKNLVGMLNQLHDAMSKGQGKNVLQPLLAKLVQYTATHFSSEEEYMRSTGYAGYDTHKAEHERITRQVVELQHRFEGGDRGVAVEILSFMEKWLTGHIQGVDKKYSPALAQN